MSALIEGVVLRSKGPRHFCPSEIRDWISGYRWNFDHAVRGGHEHRAAINHYLELCERVGAWG